MTHPDDRLIEGIRQQDKAVIHEIYDLYQSRIIHMVQKKGGSVEDGEDVFQQALGVVLFRMVQRPDFELTSKLYTLLFSISKRLWQRQLQKKRRETITDDLPEGFTNQIEEILEDRERASILWQHIDNLGNDCNRLFDMSFRQHMSDEDISSELGLQNKGSIRVKRTRCKKRLIASLRSDPRYLEILHQVA